MDFYDEPGNQDVREAGLRSQAYNLRNRWVAKLRDHLNDELDLQLAGPSANDSAELALTTAIRKCLEDDAVAAFADEMKCL